MLCSTVSGHAVLCHDMLLDLELCCTVLHDPLLCGALLCCTVLCCAVLHDPVLQCALLCANVAWHVSTLQRCSSQTLAAIRYMSSCHVAQCMVSSWDLQQLNRVLYDCAGNASHLIPVELALKVAAKIDAGEHFGCIILLPMYSEGLSMCSCSDNAPRHLLDCLVLTIMHPDWCTLSGLAQGKVRLNPAVASFPSLPSGLNPPLLGASCTFL